jgi:hypothetical protein
LDGGAWDRPTFYGDADTVEEAAALARAKLARWEEFEDQPITTMDCDDNGGQVISFTIGPSRPGRRRPVFAQLGPNESARTWLDNWNAFKANNPEAAKAQIRRARQEDESA